MQNKKTVTIIGGGASGIMAAISCKKHNPNYEVIILEKNFKLGRKILATGNGRCNISNKNTSIKNYYTSNKSKDLIENVLNEFGYDDFLEFIENLGIIIKEENRGRIFPKTNQSLTVVKAFEEEIKNLGIKIEYNTEVKNIEKKDNKFLLSTQNSKIETDYLIIATGGLSYKDLGSTGDGFKFAKRLGHTLVDNFPSITSLKIENKDAKKISGIRQEANVTIEVIEKDNTKLLSFYEEVLYTDYGLSGSSILQISRFAVDGLRNNKKVNIILDYISEKTDKELEKYIKTKIKNNSEKEYSSVLLGFVNYNLLTHLFGDMVTKKCKNITQQDINKTIENLKHKKYKVTGYKEWEQAQITAGGVSLNEINNQTLESKKIKHLYFCGEVLDVDGDCGGYNLQWAWSSGWIAGEILKQKN